MRRLTIIAVLIGAALAVPARALAHGDDGLAGGSFELDPGASVSFDGEVHYHRLVADLVADGEVVVRVVDESGATVLSAGPAADLQINELIACCDNRAWTAYRLVVENSGPTPVTVEAHAGLVHDDLAVMVHGAEPGTSESVVVMGAAWVFVLWRITRRWPRSVSGSKAAVTLAVLVAGVLALALYGSSRYGIGGAPALVAGLADVPVLPRNPIVSRASLLMGVAMIGWAVAGARWAKARPALEAAPWLMLGAAVAGAVVATGALVASAYGAVAMPLAMTLTAVVPVLAVAIRGRRWRHSSPADLQEVRA